MFSIIAHHSWYDTSRSPPILGLISNLMKHLFPFNRFICFPFIPGVISPTFPIAETQFTKFSSFMMIKEFARLVHSIFSLYSEHTFHLQVHGVELSNSWFLTVLWEYINDYKFFKKSFEANKTNFTKKRQKIWIQKLFPLKYFASITKSGIWGGKK